MILYSVNDLVQKHIDAGQVVISDYKISEKNDKILTVFLYDEAVDKYIRLSFTDYELPNGESFEMKGQPITSLVLYGFQSIFGTKTFQAMALSVVETDDENNVVVDEQTQQPKTIMIVGAKK